MSEIPEDIMNTARAVAMKIAAVLPITGSEDVGHIARAILSERRRCALIVGKYAGEANDGFREIFLQITEPQDLSSLGS